MPAAGAQAAEEAAAQTAMAAQATTGGYQHGSLCQVRSGGGGWGGNGRDATATKAHGPATSAPESSK